MSVELTFLIDDKPGEGLENEHGLSILVETPETKLLFDTGQSRKYAENAAASGIDLDDVDFAVVSHGHYDHAGGLPAFFERNTSAQVYIHSEAAKPIYYSRGRNGKVRYVGIDPETFKTWPQRFHFISEHIEAVPNIHILPCSEIGGRGPIFNDNSLHLNIDGRIEKETFDHEIYMVIERDEDLIIISGCSHNNIAAIIKQTLKLFNGKSVAAVIGGFHLPDLPDFREEHRQAIVSTGEELSGVTGLSTHQTPIFYTGHCTGDNAKMILKEILGTNIDFFHTGYRIII